MEQDTDQRRNNIMPDQPAKGFNMPNTNSSTVELTYDPKNTGSIKAAIVKIKADYLTARVMTVLDEFYQDNTLGGGAMLFTKQDIADLGITQITDVGAPTQHERSHHETETQSRSQLHGTVHPSKFGPVPCRQTMGAGNSRSKPLPV